MQFRYILYIKFLNNFFSLLVFFLPLGSWEWGRATIRDGDAEYLQLKRYSQLITKFDYSISRCVSENILAT